jgi:hypothetical protein
VAVGSAVAVVSLDELESGGLDELVASPAPLDGALATVVVSALSDDGWSTAAAFGPVTSVATGCDTESVVGSAEVTVVCVVSVDAAETVGPAENGSTVVGSVVAAGSGALGGVVTSTGSD